MLAGTCRQLEIFPAVKAPDESLGIEASLFLVLDGRVLSVEKVEYWFNTETGEVEVEKQTLASNRLGPFDNREDAANALQIIAERAAKLRAEDQAEDWD